MLIEIYLDLADLTPSQTLVILDEQGQRWDVDNALNPPAQPKSRPPSRSGRSSQVVLERWKLKVEKEQHDAFLRMGADGYPSSEVSKAYRSACLTFTSLYSQMRLLPTWKYYRRIAKNPPNHPSLKLRYRIINGDFKPPRRDTLQTPLYRSAEPVIEKYEFAPLKFPCGPLSISVAYRTNCDFRVDDAESILSSHFMNEDGRLFGPSLARAQRETTPVPGSLPVRGNRTQEEPDHSMAYGSMSTFHQAGVAAGTSPMTALRAVRDGPSSPPSPPQKMPPNHRTAQGSRPSLRTGDLPYQRRTSVSFQHSPFKAGSLASSPAGGSQIPPSPGTSAGRVNPLLQARNRNSLNTTLPQTALRAPIPNETAIASSASASPKPAPINRYSSSFSNRKNRFSSGGASKTDDENNSSGKNSLNSSAQRGSGTITEGDDDSNLKEFISMLEQNKELPSFNRNDTASRVASVKRTTAALSRYQGMKESTTALSDSLSSSLLLHRSSSSSSRHLSNVPPMIAGASVSTASSPGKPISPHTPHTPAIPSRLSANSTLDYGDQAHRSRSRSRNAARRIHETRRDESSSDTTTTRDGTAAIPIPVSPRPQHNRRSSSATNQPRNADEEQVLRSASQPLDDPETVADPLGWRSGEDVPYGAMHWPIAPSFNIREPSDMDRNVELSADSSRRGSRDSNLAVNAEGAANRPSYTNFDSEDSTGYRDMSTNYLSGVPNYTSQPSAVRGRVTRSVAQRFNPAIGRGDAPMSRGSRVGHGSRASIEEDDLLFDLSELQEGQTRDRRSNTDETRSGSSTGAGDRLRRGQGWR